MAGNITTIYPIVTTPGCEVADTPLYWGFITAIMAVCFYGIMFLPVKKFQTGDGLFFQWVFGTSIGLYGLVVQQVRGNPQFYPGVMIGGALFITGNLTVVPIIKLIGMGLGFSIWGITNLLSGWATGRFGLFGLKADPPDNLILNDIGVTMAVISAVLFAMVKVEIMPESIDQIVTVDISESSPLLHDTEQVIEQKQVQHPDCEVIVIPATRKNRGVSIAQNDTPEVDSSVIDRMSPTMRRIVGIGLSLGAGLIYGQVFTPFIYVQNNYKGASQNALDYVFSTICGAAIACTVYFLIYAAYMRNRPKIYPRVIIPAFVSGLLWTGGTTCWFVANKVLSESVAFPIVTTGPAVVANLFSVLIFKEIKGFRNILILVFGMVITISGALMAGFSKKSTTCG